MVNGQWITKKCVSCTSWGPLQLPTPNPNPPPLGQGGRGRSKGGERPMGTTACRGKGSKGRAANGDRPVGAARCRRDHHTMTPCQTPPPLKEARMFRGLGPHLVPIWRQRRRKTFFWRFWFFR